MENTEKTNTSEQPNEAYDAWADLGESEQQVEKDVEDKYDIVVDFLTKTREASGHEVNQYWRGRINVTARQLTRRDNVGASCGEIQSDWQAPLDGLQDISQTIFDEYAANIALASIFNFSKYGSRDNNSAFNEIITSIPKNKLTPTVVDFLSDANRWTNPGNKDFNVGVSPTVPGILTRYVNGTEADVQYLESIGGQRLHHPGETRIIGFDRDGDAMYGDDSYDEYMVPIRNLMPDHYRGNRPDFKRKSYVLQKVASERIEEMKKKQKEFRLPDIQAKYRAIELAMQEIVNNSYKQLTPDIVSKIYYKLAESNDEGVKDAIMHSPTLPLELQKTLQQHEIETM